MKVLIVYAHPEPASFTAAMKNTAVEAVEAAGHEAVVSDLYAQNFNPVISRADFLTVADPDRFHYQSEGEEAAKVGGFAPDIAREHDRISEAGLIILNFPIYWGGMPAILKGWFDRCFSTGVIGFDGRRFETGLYKGRRGLIGISSGASTARMGPGGCYGEVKDVLHGVRQCCLEAIGLDVAEPFVAYATARVDDETRRQYLVDWGQLITNTLSDKEWVEQNEGDLAERVEAIRREIRSSEAYKSKGWTVERGAGYLQVEGLNKTASGRSGA